MGWPSACFALFHLHRAHGRGDFGLQFAATDPLETSKSKPSQSHCGHYGNTSQNAQGGSLSTPLFGVPPFSIKHSQDNFSRQNAIDALQNVNWGGEISVFLYKACRLEVSNSLFEGTNLHFGGCHFTFWRLKLSWGCLFEKGGSPKSGVL